MSIPIDQSIPLGTMQLNMNFSPNPFDSSFSCSLQGGGFNIVGSSSYTVTITPSSPPRAIPSGDTLRCDFTVRSSFDPRSFSLSLSGSITFPDGGSVSISGSGDGDINCLNDDHCDSDEVCDLSSGDCEDAPTPTPTEEATASPTATEVPVPVSLPITLMDGGGYIWDIAQYGAILGGSMGAFSNGLDLSFNSQLFPLFPNALSEQAGRAITIGPWAKDAFLVRRQVYVPTDDAFVRYLDIVDNTTSSPQLATLTILSGLGSGAQTVVVSTSSGDTTIGNSDDFVVTDDGPNGAPAIAHVFSNPGAAIEPTGVSLVNGSFFYTYTPTVPGNSRVIIMHFASQNPDSTLAVQSAQALYALGNGPLRGLSSTERAAVINFKLPSDRLLVFDNSTYVDSAGSVESESDNLQASLTSLGFNVATFTDISASSFASELANAGILVFPEFENGVLAPNLSEAARQAIRGFVAAGGDVIAFTNAPDLLNALFGFSLDYGTSGASTKSADALSTECSGAPNALPDNNGMLALNTSMLPADSLALYTVSGGTTVAIMPYGAGRVAFLGWDWYDASPVGSQDGGWLNVLSCVIQEVR